MASVVPTTVVEKSFSGLDRRFFAKEAPGTLSLAFRKSLGRLAERKAISLLEKKASAKRNGAIRQIKIPSRVIMSRYSQFCVEFGKERSKDLQE
jgi:hypothetical protein